MAARRDGLDELDRKVLHLIRERPRTGLLEIARLLGVARGTVQARLDRMVADGVITDFGPNLSPRALGYPVQAFTTLEVEQITRPDISTALTAIPEVLEAHIVTGPGDVWCRIAGRDHEHIQQVIDQTLAIPGVRRSSTVITLSTVVAHRVQPLADDPQPVDRRSP
ncbi:Lrp/AsnC family transcriptional regulator [Streptosporangium roseum]|uniref:Lrp/AsnC family transcriptional regulator n=1 Tax=Streptosporangium roseum TaxID=2001 RepID=UPI0004CD3040|nr:Lrp/AsnC family transcriptional regulator [Streptosporangium roseum]